MTCDVSWSFFAALSWAKASEFLYLPGSPQIKIDIVACGTRRL
jgi:hypothetical protein